MATSLSTYGPPSNTWFLQPIRAHKPNGIPIGSAVFGQATVECPYTLQLDAHSPPKFAPSHGGDLDPHLIRGSQAHPSTQTQTAARSVQPFLQGSLVWQTDHATRSVRIGRIYVRSTAMRPKNNRASLVRPTLILWPSDSFQNSNIIMLNAHLATVGKLAVIKQLDLLTVTLVELQRSLDNHSVSQSTEAQMSQLIWQTVIACW